jgi:hypothetical protein
MAALSLPAIGAPENELQDAQTNDNCTSRSSFDPQSMMFWGTDLGAPKDKLGKPEFNSYDLYACIKNQQIDRLILVRSRPTGGPQMEIVGRIELPKSVIMKARTLAFPKGKPSYLNMVTGRCSLLGDPNEIVNALVPGTTEAEGEVMPKNVVFAWKVDSTHKTLLEVPNRALRVCFGG